MDEIRLQQMLSHIKRTVSEIIPKVNHEDLHDVVVTDVLLDNDQKRCLIIVTAPESSLKLLNGHYRHQIQQKFNQSYQRRSVPLLQFILDDGARETIEVLLAKATTNP